MTFYSTDKIYYIITVTILFICFFVVLKTAYSKLKSGYFSVAFPVIGAMFLFLGFPIVLDVLFGPPNFRNYRGFYYALQDTRVAVYYNLYIIYTVIIFYIYIKKIKNRKFSFDTTGFYNTIYRYRRFLWLLLVLPILAVALSVRPLEYLNYQAIQLNVDRPFKESHVLVFRFTLLAAVSGAFLFYFLKGKKDFSIIFKYIIFFILMFIAFWVDGKRGIFFKFFFVFLVAGLLMGKIQPKKLWLYLIPGIFILTSIVLLYGKDFASNNKYSRDAYSSLRLNVGRDHTIKYTLYKEYVKDEMILQHRGQSFLFGLTFFIPRSIWPEKPYPYAVYFVTSVINAPPEPIGWSFTTCILEEFISNLGFLGLIIAPFFLLWVCKVGDNAKNKFLTIISVVCGVFFLFTQMAAFMPIILVFIFLLCKEKFSKYKFRLT
ncbi:MULTISPECIES: hypothetical protein [unclassified Sphingobacterium]|uniref:hypothetical protein n=1 Tax=unclassified Sphingobacterium TaxID=2609468 RepID=UPI0025CFFF6F|nr:MULTISPECIES: hypothetical protein [unclassified Sphingobacterium]